MKRKAKNFIRGSISILLVIIMMPMLTMSAIVVDSSRLNLAKSMVSSAGDLAVNTALANYDTILKDVYGLFAMSQIDSDEDFSEKIKQYFATTLVGYGVVDEENAEDYAGDVLEFAGSMLNGTNGMDELSRNFMQMEIEDFSATKDSNSSLANSEILRTQLVEYMKYRAPLTVGLSFLDSLKSFTTIQDQTNVVKTQVAAQESAQTVTRACSTAMQSIRDYDKLIDSIETGDKAVKGLNSSADGQPVAIKNYDEQVEKYKSSWAEKYSHINTLTLVFFTKNPGVGDKMLGKLGSSRFIDPTKSYNLNTSNSGISLNVSVSGDQNGAKSEYDSQKATLNGLVGKSNSYAAQSFVPLGGVNISNDNTYFVNETNATGSFIAYEQFLLNKNSTINYSDITNIIEQIYKFRKYYENYQAFLKAIEDKEKAEMDDAKAKSDAASNDYSTKESKRAGIISSANTSKSYIIDYNIPYINEQTKAFDGDYSFLNGSISTTVDSLLMPLSANTSVKTISGYNFVNFSWLNNKISVSGADKNIYMQAFGSIVNSNISDVNSQLLSKAKDFYSKTINKKTSQAFSSFVTVDKNSDLYKLLNTLYLCSAKANTMLENIKKYDSIVNGYATAATAASAALTAKNTAYSKYIQEQTQYNTAKTNRINLETDYCNTVKQFCNGINRYQDDLSSYSNYIKTAKNVAAKEASAIKKQFTDITSNLKTIIDQLNVIGTNLNTVNERIVSYNKNVDKWSSQNSSYASKNGSDSFSDQNKSEIESSRKKYDSDQLKNLQDFVTSYKTEFESLYNYLINTANYKYGTTRIDAIDSADKLISAVSGVKGSLPDVVTISDATGKLNTLYPGWDAPNIFPDGESLQFLKPTVIPLQFLNFLVANFPEIKSTTSNSTGANGSGNMTTTSSEEADYNSAKEEMKGGAEKPKEATGYGYTYQIAKPLVKSDLPSGTSDETVKVADYKLNEKDNGDLDASSGFSEQASILDTVLSGIGNIATAGLENLYILSYIFENFSYSTIEQDIIAKSLNKEEANYSNRGQITPDKYTSKLTATTLSNYKINAYNNYLYGGEIEYILYGNATAKTNVTTAKGIIYALRFAFNCIYAFTNAEIKATTMSAGLAVQAATCGIVPYQVVQIVLQLALAAAEAAVDLDFMNHGLDVALIKTKDTWALSVSGAMNTAKEIAVQAAGTAVDALATTVTKTVSGGIQKVLDATADNISGAIDDLSTDLESAVIGKAEDVVNTAFSVVNSNIDKALNQVQFLDYSENLATAKEEVNKLFDEAQNINYSELFPDNEIAQTVLSSNLMQAKANEIINGTRNKVLAVLNDSTVSNPGAVIAEAVNGWKKEAMTNVRSGISSVFVTAKNSVYGYVSDIKTKIGNIATEKVENMTEDAADKLKEKISSTTNEFMNKYITDGNAVSSVGSGLDANTSNGGTSLANIIAFGYKEYLMLFTYLKLCTSTGPDSTVMKRIADVIQLNFTKMEASEFAHPGNKAAEGDTPAKSFSMSKAYTYVHVDATVSLDMLFLDMEFFNRMITDDSGEGGTVDVESDLSGTKIKYSGFLGY